MPKPLLYAPEAAANRAKWRFCGSDVGWWLPPNVALLCVAGFDCILIWAELTAGLAAMQLWKAFHRGCVAAAFALGQLEAHRFFAPFFGLDEMTAAQTDVLVLENFDEVADWESKDLSGRGEYDHG